MIRVIVQSVVEGVIKLVAAAGRIGEIFTGREYMQHYGFTSRPLAGAEGVMINWGNHYIMIASDDRRYRIPVEAGEVCIYTDEGDSAHFKRGREIHVSCGGRLVADVAVETVVTCPLVTVAAATRVLLDTPQVHCTGNLLVDGGISSAGTYGESGGLISTPGDVRDGVHTMAADRAIYDGHTHPDAQGGTTGQPNQQE